MHSTYLNISVQVVEFRSYRYLSRINIAPVGIEPTISASRGQCPLPAWTTGLRVVDRVGVAPTASPLQAERSATELPALGSHARPADRTGRIRTYNTDVYSVRSVPAEDSVRGSRCGICTHVTAVTGQWDGILPQPGSLPTRYDRAQSALQIGSNGNLRLPELDRSESNRPQPGYQPDLHTSGGPVIRTVSARTVGPSSEPMILRVGIEPTQTGSRVRHPSPTWAFGARLV